MTAPLERNNLKEVFGVYIFNTNRKFSGHFVLGVFLYLFLENCGRISLR